MTVPVSGQMALGGLEAATDPEPSQAAHSLYYTVTPESGGDRASLAGPTCNPFEG